MCVQTLSRQRLPTAQLRASKVPILSRLEFASGICFHGLARFFNRGVSIRNSRGAGGYSDLADSASFGWIDPAAVGFEATVCADGAED